MVDTLQNLAGFLLESFQGGVLFIRHANTDKNDTNDSLRGITPLGLDQTQAAREGWFQHHISARAIMSSEATRCIHTARNVSRETGLSVAPLKTAYFGNEGPGKSLMERRFAEHGYASLTEYAKGDNSIQKVLDEARAHTTDVLTEIKYLPWFQMNNMNKDGNTLVICGHAVFINMMALAIAEEWNLHGEAKNVICNVNMGEVHGLHVGPYGVAYYPTRLHNGSK